MWVVSIRGAQLAPVGKAVGRVLHAWVRLLRGLPVVYAVVAMVLSVAAVLTGIRAVPSTPRSPSTNTEAWCTSTP